MWVSPAALSSQDRKAIHNVAEKLNLNSVSKGDGANRVVVITKELPKENGLMNTTLMRKFRNDFNLKINLCDENDFEYFVDLYSARDKLDILNASRERYGDENFPEVYENMKITVSRAISETPGFQRFHVDDLSQFEDAHKLQLTQGTVYLTEYRDDFFLSLDLKSANFSAMKYYDESMVMNSDSWTDLLNKFTDDPYFHHSKAFRQKIFWFLDADKINIVEKYLIFQIKTVLQHLLDGKEVFTNTDEIIVKLSKEEIQDFCALCISELHSSPLTSQLLEIIRVEAFTLRVLSLKQKFFVKEIFSVDTWTKISYEFKNIPTQYYAVCHKFYNSMQIEERDLKEKFNAVTGDFDMINIEDLGLLPTPEISFEQRETER
eukprot:TRINITY_DN9704_c0_g1_i1.p1 TRINITY_DN9704_c0_g1~~TRINITY_DN9704_c0_g1_i1.p1  ORF type:complete len:377 (-),score=80.66 TRINITY_DN9704_c0_g1_i1:849-1979(-)